MTWTQSLAEMAGAQESGLKLILGQMAGYPIFLVHRQFLRKADAWVQHLFFALTGLFMSWWAIGESAVFHSSLCVLVTYATLKVLDSRKNAAIAMFIFNLIYLFAGYVLTASEEYDITWTMPGCVICLRLIGLAIDVYDGGRPKEELSKNEAANALVEIPSLLECFSHSFFIGGYFVGPQFCMRRFQDYVERNRSEEGDRLPSPVAFGFKRLGLGWLYMAMHLVGSGYVPENWVRTDEFAQMGFVTRSFWFAVWVKVILAKYIAAWLFAEGSCIVSGLAYNGVDPNTKETLWNGMANVKLRLFESCRVFDHMIQSFNINTNAWVAHYIYKRLKFLNNRTYSQLGVLVFLAIWHGYHSGYYVTFFNEFLVMGLEKEIVGILKKSPFIQRTFIENPLGAMVANAIGYVYVLFLLPHCFLAFALLKRNKYMAPLIATSFFLYIFVAAMHGIKFLLKKVILTPKKKEGEETKKEN